MAEAHQNPLAPDTAARLTAFARACKGAARAVALYPPEHPTIGDAMQRLARAAAGATEFGPLSILVIPDNLLVGGRAPARPDAAIAEFASLLHDHMVGEITIRRDVEPAAWRILLALLGREPEDVRAHGGIARALTTAGGIGLEITELDYSGLVKERGAGSEASWDTIIASCIQTNVLDLDEKTLRVLGEIARDPARLAELFARTEEHAGSLTTRERNAALLRALRGVTGFFGREDSSQIDRVFDNMASAISHVSPDFVMEMLAIGREPGSDDASLVVEITQRITDPTLA